jgi:hypothetical protein
MFNDWLIKNEAIWLFWVLFTETLIGLGTLIFVIKEYFYDAAKDEEKKQRKTKTTKKVTESKDGAKTVEETTETSEPMHSEETK